MLSGVWYRVLCPCVVGSVGMLVPFDRIPVGEGLLPDGTRAPFYIDRAELDVVRESGPASKYDDARFIDECVTDPDAIFRGLRRPNQSDSLCYSVFPEHDPDDANDSESYAPARPPVFGFVFLAFVTQTGMGYLVFDWEWRESSPNDPGHPLHWETDFAGRAWHRT